MAEGVILHRSARDNLTNTLARTRIPPREAPTAPAAGAPQPGRMIPRVVFHRPRTTTQHRRFVRLAHMRPTTPHQPIPARDDQDSRSAGPFPAPTVATMTAIEYITLETDDLTAAEEFYSKGLELGPLVRLKPAEAPSSGFRGYSLSLVASQPGNVDALLEASVAHGATVLKPGAKSLWGYGAIAQAPDGAIWKFACSSKKDSAPVEKRFDSFTVLLGTTDMNATKQFYTDHGLTVAKSYGRKYTEFEAGDSPIHLALYPRKGFAKDLGIPIEGSGSHRITLGGAAGPATDPDGFAWEPAS